MKLHAVVCLGLALVGCKDKEKEARIAMQNAMYEQQAEEDKAHVAKFAVDGPAFVARLEKLVASPPLATVPVPKGAPAPAAENTLVFPTDPAALRSVIDGKLVDTWWPTNDEAPILKAIREKAKAPRNEAGAFSRIKYIALATGLDYVRPVVMHDAGEKAFEAGYRFVEAQLYSVAGDYYGGVRFSVRTSKTVRWTQPDNRPPANVQLIIESDLARNVGTGMWALLPTVVGLPMGKIRPDPDALAGAARSLVAGPDAGSAADDVDDPKTPYIKHFAPAFHGIRYDLPTAATPGWTIRRARKDDLVIEAPRAYEPKPPAAKATAEILSLVDQTGHAIAVVETATKLANPNDCRDAVDAYGKGLDLTATSAELSSDAGAAVCTGTLEGATGAARTYTTTHAGAAYWLACLALAPGATAKDLVAVCDRVWATRRYEKLPD